MITRREFMGGGFAALLAAQFSGITGKEAGLRAAQPPESADPLRETMARRRTIRSYRDEPVPKADLLEIMWAAQGITDPGRGYRAVPSAGALYPLQIHLFTGVDTVVGLEEGVHLYDPGTGEMGRVSRQDSRARLAIACLSQTWIRHAPASLVISAVYRRTTGKYGKRGIRYADIEAGCAAQNVFLMAVARGLAAGIVGAFQDDAVRQLTGEGEENTPLLVMTVGHRG